MNLYEARLLQARIREAQTEEELADIIGEAISEGLVERPVLTPEEKEQFRYIQETVEELQAQDEPITMESLTEALEAKEEKKEEPLTLHDLEKPVEIKRTKRKSENKNNV